MQDSHGVDEGTERRAHASCHTTRTTPPSVKVFGVGLNKTGTTSLRLCGDMLGFRSIGCRSDLLEDLIVRCDVTRLAQVANEHEFFADWPWPLAYRCLDEMFPGSKFILTTRVTEDAWLTSLKRHSMHTHPFHNCRKLAYGYHFPHMHPDEHIEFYRRHNANVRGFFQNRQDQFLEVCWETGHGWHELCAFLHMPAPNFPFPYANRGHDFPSVSWRSIANRMLSRIGI